MVTKQLVFGEQNLSVRMEFQKDSWPASNFNTFNVCGKDSSENTARVTAFASIDIKIKSRKMTVKRRNQEES